MRRRSLFGKPGGAGISGPASKDQQAIAPANSMRVLIVHHEAEYFAGAEVLLGYFLDQARSTDCQITVAVVEGSRARQVIPAGTPTLAIRNNARFTLRGFAAQLTATVRAVRRERIDLVHGWAARDWELAAAVGKITRRPALGTLHDHPQARFISAKRQRLMRWCANWGFRRVICISEAVQSACIAAGYSPGKLVVVHNGLPGAKSRVWKEPPDETVRLGFLGAISERKGLRGLFAMMEGLANRAPVGWELFIAGAPQDESGAELQRSLQRAYGQVSWAPRVHWCGWVDQPLDFLTGIDLLICPSSEFEPFGLVVCEAAALGIPTVAARSGGLAEIVDHGKTGWLFNPGDWQEGAARLAEAVQNPEQRRISGQKARERVGKCFGIEKMVAEYLRVYASLLAAQ